MMTAWYDRGTPDEETNCVLKMRPHVMTHLECIVVFRIQLTLVIRGTDITNFHYITR